MVIYISICYALSQLEITPNTCSSTGDDAAQNIIQEKTPGHNRLI